jgi:hypothetical protein
MKMYHFTVHLEVFFFVSISSEIELSEQASEGI